MKRRGLATEVTKNNVKYFEATDPDRIIDYLNVKKNEINISIDETKKFLPELKRYQNMHLEKQEARVYTGIEGWKTVYNEILSSLGGADEYIAFGLGKVEAEEKFVSGFIRKFHQRRVEKGAGARVILRPEAKQGIRENFPKSMKNTKIKYTSIKIPTNIAIWKDNVLTLVWGENPVAFVIHSKQVADKYKEYFEYVWKSARI